MPRHRSSKTLTPAERSRAHRAARLADGWTEQTVRLSPQNSTWAREEIARRSSVASIAALINAMMDDARG